MAWIEKTPFMGCDDTPNRKCPSAPGFSGRPWPWRFPPGVQPCCSGSPLRTALWDSGAGCSSRLEEKDGWSLEPFMHGGKILRRYMGESYSTPSPLLSMSDTHSHPLVPGLRGCKALMVVSRSWPHLGRACMSALARMLMSQAMPLMPDRLGTTCSVLSQRGRKTVGRSSRCSRSCIQVALSRKQEVIEKRQECKEVVEC